MWTIESIKAANAKAGLHFFDPSAMRFFRSRILSTVYEGPGGVYFVTSEQFQFKGEAHPRKFTVTRFDPKTGRIDRASEFQAFATAAQAKGAAKKFAAGVLK